MGDVTRLKVEVERLTLEEEAELLAWLVDRDHARWDEQIARDQKSGKLGRLIGEAKADRMLGKAIDL